MYATIFLIALLLAILAHIKLYMLTTSMNGAFALVSDRIKALSNDVRHLERSIELVRSSLAPSAPSASAAPAVLITQSKVISENQEPKVVGPAVTPAAPVEAPSGVDDAEIAALLQIYYGLSPDSRNALDLRSKLSNAVSEEFDSASAKAADLQNVLRTYNRATYDLVSKAIFAASVLTRPAVVAPVEVSAPVEISVAPAGAAVVGPPKTIVEIDVVQADSSNNVDLGDALTDNVVKSKTSGRKPKKIKKSEKSE